MYNAELETGYGASGNWGGSQSSSMPSPALTSSLFLLLGSVGRQSPCLMTKSFGGSSVGARLCALGMFSQMSSAQKLPS